MAGEHESGWDPAEVDGQLTTLGDDAPHWVLGDPDRAVRSDPDRAVRSDPDRTEQAPAHATRVAEPPAPFGWTDGLTESEGPRFWDRVVAVEQARNARHARTGTIVLFEVVGFGAAVDRWGSTLALQLFVELSRVLSRGMRDSDHLARIAPARFAVLLTETDEILAINYVDRIKEACQRELDPASNGMRVVVGWASPKVGRSLAEAYEMAESRLVEALAREA
ncbi:MAG TPA: diguanylate cyclase [Candidatus Limnocylindrales bacterium]|nr:diguanylate cyclase [Candidatus Limnocylindrales bacterium]